MIKNRQPPDYDRFADEFLYQYFPANFIKVRAEIRTGISLLGNNLSVLDLGCGSGASTAAIVQAAREIGVNISGIVAIDKSPAQIEVFRDTTEKWIKMVFPNVSVDLVQGDVLDRLADIEPSGFDVKLSSFLTTEISQRESDRISSFVGSGGLVLDVSSPEGCSKNYGEVVANYEFEKAPIHRAAVREVHPATLVKYFETWRKHDFSQLQALFTPSVVYEISSSKCLRGFGELSSYWEENSREQRDVCWEILSCYMSNNTTQAEWRSVFERIDKSCTYVVLGRLEFTEDAGLISTFRESYTRKSYAAR